MPWGGARTEGLDPPGLVEQVSAYVVVEELALSPTALFVIWIGGNDFLNRVFSFDRLPGGFGARLRRRTKFRTLIFYRGGQSTLGLNDVVAQRVQRIRGAMGNVLAGFLARARSEQYPCRGDDGGSDGRSQHQVSCPCASKRFLARIFDDIRRGR